MAFKIKLYDYPNGDADICIGGENLNLIYLDAMLELAGGQDVDVHISSVGGSAFEAIGMYDSLKKYKGVVNTYIDALAASAASIVAMGGQKVIMSKYALLMIHKPMVGSGGNADDLSNDIAMLNIVQSRLAGIYMDKTGLGEDEINALINVTTWLTSEQALELNFIDEIEDYSGSEVTNLAQMIKYADGNTSVYHKRVFNKLKVAQNQIEMNIVDKELQEKTISVLDKVLNFFKKSTITTVTNKGIIKSLAPLNVGVPVTNEDDTEIDEDGEFEVDNEGNKVKIKVEGGIITNMEAEPKDGETEEEVKDALVLNSAGLKVTNKADAAGVAKVVSNYQAKIVDQNALIADLSNQLKVSNEAVARDEEKIKADIKSEFTPAGSKRSDTTKVENKGAMPKFIADKVAGNAMLGNAIKIAENSAKQ